MKPKEAAKKLENGIEETLTYYDFPGEHWTRIRTNNVVKRLNWKIRCRTRVMSSFPDGNSVLMLVYAWLRHVADTQWGNRFNKFCNQMAFLFLKSQVFVCCFECRYSKNT